MLQSSRRRFLREVTAMGVGASASALFGDFLRAQAPASEVGTGPIRVYLDTRRTRAALDRNIFGSFLEHLGRAIYEGIYDPKSALSDSNGYRKDVLEEIRKLSVPMIRYPGGNFVSGYNWLDGVGPKQGRPRVLDKAWNSMNSNEFGTNEFLAWCKAAGTQPLLAVNLGTGTPEDAAALVEYCNVDQGTRWSELRRKHGVADPHRVRHWCLGNEMDGPWQIGHMSATEYGWKAADAGRQMRYVDRDLTLVACGSSGPGMPTYLEFAEVTAVCDFVRGRLRSKKKLWLSFDEWNVWYRARSGSATDGHRQEAPHLLEEVYNLEDALLVGGCINTLLRSADRVKIGCLAQLVNVIAPLMTNTTGLVRQTILYPYSWALQHGRGSVLDVLMENCPTYESSGTETAAFAGPIQAAEGVLSVFVLNRDLAKPREVELNWEDRTGGRLLMAQVLTGSDLKAVNDFAAPTRVVPKAADKPVASGARTRIEVPPRSYSSTSGSFRTPLGHKPCQQTHK